MQKGDIILYIKLTVLYNTGMNKEPIYLKSQPAPGSLAVAYVVDENTDKRYVIEVWRFLYGSYKSTGTKVIYSIPGYYHKITEEEWLLEYM